MSSPDPLIVKFKALPPLPAAKLALSAKADIKKYEDVNHQMQQTQTRLIENEQQLAQLKQFRSGLLALQSAEAKTFSLCHDLLVASIAKAIYPKYSPKPEVTKQLTPAEKQAITSQAAAKCKEIVAPYISECAKSDPQTFYRLIEKKDCMRLTPEASACLLKILNDHQTAMVDLRSFKDEIDQQALEALLTDRRIKKLVLTKSNQGTDLERFLSGRNFPVQYA